MGSSVEDSLIGRRMRLHPLDLDVRCPHCLRGHLEFVAIYVIGDKYRCASCRRTIIHHRRKGTIRCGLVPLLGFGSFGTWKENACLMTHGVSYDASPN